MKAIAFVSLVTDQAWSPSPFYDNICQFVSLVSLNICVSRPMILIYLAYKQAATHSGNRSAIQKQIEQWKMPDT